MASRGAPSRSLSFSADLFADNDDDDDDHHGSDDEGNWDDFEEPAVPDPAPLSRSASAEEGRTLLRQGLSGDGDDGDDGDDGNGAAAGGARRKKDDEERAVECRTTAAVAGEETKASSSAASSGHQHIPRKTLGGSRVISFDGAELNSTGGPPKRWDGKGIMYWMGTNEGQRAWANPVSVGVVQVRLHNGRRGPRGDFKKGPWVTLEDRGCVFYAVRLREHVAIAARRGDSDGVGIEFDISKYEVRPTRYAIRHGDVDDLRMAYAVGLIADGSPYAVGCLRNWELQARSSPAEPWQTLRVHREDDTLSKQYTGGEGERPQYATASWDLEPKGGPGDFYRHFRVLQTGPNSRGGYQLCISGFELWGAVRHRTRPACGGRCGGRCKACRMANGGVFTFEKKRSKLTKAERKKLRAEEKQKGKQQIWGSSVDMIDHWDVSCDAGGGGGAAGAAGTADAPKNDAGAGAAITAAAQETKAGSNPSAGAESAAAADCGVADESGQISSSFRSGDRVEATVRRVDTTKSRRVFSGPRAGRMCTDPGIIICANGDGTYDIRFDDGEERRDVQACHIRGVGGGGGASGDAACASAAFAGAAGAAGGGATGAAAEAEASESRSAAVWAVDRAVDEWRADPYAFWVRHVPITDDAPKDDAGAGLE